MSFLCRHKYKIRCAEFVNINKYTVIDTEDIGGFVWVDSRKRSYYDGTYDSYCERCTFYTYTEIVTKNKITCLKVYIKECEKCKKRIKCDAFDAQEFIKMENELNEVLKEF